MKKYLALALIAALAAFAAPSFADMTGDNGNYTWTESDNSKTINSLTINSGATLTMVSNAVVNGINATISGVGAGSTIKGANVNDFYGISSIRDLDIIADKGSSNIHIGAALQNAVNADAVSLTMSGVTSSNISSALQYVKVAPQIVKNRDAATPTTIGSANITIDNATVGHSLFGGPLAINGNKHELAITNSEIVINGTSQIGRAIYAGGGVWGTNNTTRVENARIIVNGGTIGGTGQLSDRPTENGMIYGGGLVENDNTEGSSSTVGNVEIIINGGSVKGVRGGGRIDTITEHGADVTKVDNVIIVIDGAATIGDGGVKAGSEKVKRGADENHGIVEGSVADASVVIKNVPAGATFEAPISGEGCVDEAADIELQNVKGTINSIAQFGNVGVDPNTSATINNLSDKPVLQLVGDWRDESGVREINLDDLVKVQNGAIKEVFTLDEEDKPYYDTEETGITSLEANPDGTFTATVERPARQHSGGGGGCSAGFGALALLAALPLIRMRKK